MSAAHQRNARLRLHPYCCHCGERLGASTATLEHIIPASLGGGAGSNLVLACAFCNHDRSSDDFMVYRALASGGDVHEVLWLNRSWYEGEGDYLTDGDTIIVGPQAEADQALVGIVANRATLALRKLRPTPEKKPRLPRAEPTRRGQKFKELVRERTEAKAARINYTPQRPMASAFLHAFPGGT